MSKGCSMYYEEDIVLYMFPSCTLNRFLFEFCLQVSIYPPNIYKIKFQQEIYILLVHLKKKEEKLQKPHKFYLKINQRKSPKGIQISFFAFLLIFPSNFLWRLFKAAFFFLCAH